MTRHRTTARAEGEPFDDGLEAGEGGDPFSEGAVRASTSPPAVDAGQLRRLVGAAVATSTVTGRRSAGRLGDQAVRDTAVP